MIVRSLVLCTILGAVATALAAEPERVAEPVDFGGLYFQGFSEQGSVLVAPRKRRIRRCARCHAQMDPNPAIRDLLDAPHVDYLEHGRGRFWCLTCHDEIARDLLVTLLGERIDIYKAYAICGSCHADRQRDWFFGGHGKRLENWDGQRVIYNCTHCHDPHKPAIKARKPEPPPHVRIGLQAMKDPQRTQRDLWERHFQEQHLATDEKRSDEQ